MSEEKGVNWEKVEHEIKDSIKKTISDHLKDDPYDPHGEFILSYCHRDTDHYVDLLVRELIDAWLK